MKRGQTRAGGEGTGRQEGKTAEIWSMNIIMAGLHHYGAVGVTSRPLFPFGARELEIILSQLSGTQMSLPCPLYAGTDRLVATG